jgi:hypothetical protein
MWRVIEMAARLSNYQSLTLFVQVTVRRRRSTYKTVERPRPSCPPRHSSLRCGPMPPMRCMQRSRGTFSLARTTSDKSCTLSASLEPLNTSQFAHTENVVVFVVINAINRVHHLLVAVKNASARAAHCMSSTRFSGGRSIWV